MKYEVLGNNKTTDKRGGHGLQYHRIGTFYCFYPGAAHFLANMVHHGLH